MRYIDEVSKELDNNTEFQALLPLKIGPIEVAFDPSIGPDATIGDLDKDNYLLRDELGLTKSGSIAWRFLYSGWNESDLLDEYYIEDKDWVLNDTNTVICSLLVFMYGGRITQKLKQKYDNSNVAIKCRGIIAQHGIHLQFTQSIGQKINKVLRIRGTALQEQSDKCLLAHRRISEIMAGLEFILTDERLSGKAVKIGTIAELSQELLKEFEN